MSNTRYELQAQINRYNAAVNDVCDRLNAVVAEVNGLGGADVWLRLVPLAEEGAGLVETRDRLLAEMAGR